MKICGIYLITNLINNKKYVGQSVDIYDRWIKHKAPSAEKYSLQAAFEKYGINNFKFEIIEQCLPSELDEREIYWIAYYDSYNNGYNETIGSQGNKKYDYQYIYSLWQDGMNCREIENTLQCDDQTITRALNSYGLTEEMIRSRSKIKRPIVAFDVDTKMPLKIFDSIHAASNFFNSHPCDTRVIWNGIKNHHRAYGYYWEYFNSTNKPLQQLSDTEFLQYQKKTKKVYTDEQRLELSIKNRQVTRPTREQLKDEIRTIPFTTIGEKYNVSDNAVRKWCAFYNLPYKKSNIKQYSDEEWKLI